MADVEQPIENTWAAVLAGLSADSTITPMLYGFLNLVEPKGIAAGTFYLEVPNDFTASMLNQRMRTSLLAAMSAIGTPAIANFYVVVNPELESEVATQQAFETQEAGTLARPRCRPTWPHLRWCSRRRMSSRRRRRRSPCSNTARRSSPMTPG